MIGMRRGPAILMFGCGTMVLASACSETTRHRVLSFFFDGVPPPSRSEAGEPGEVPPSTEPQAPPRKLVRYYTHTPYRDNRCGGCHDADAGGLVRTVSEGLCLLCHGPLVKERPFLHGPVAVNDCGVCHHPHASTFPNLLLAEPDATCRECHDPADLTEGPYHATLSSQGCVECHDPHGADNRFFLKRVGP